MISNNGRIAKRTICFISRALYFWCLLRHSVPDPSPCFSIAYQVSKPMNLKTVAASPSCSVDSSYSSTLAYMMTYVQLEKQLGVSPRPGLGSDTDVPRGFCVRTS